MEYKRSKNCYSKSSVLGTWPGTLVQNDKVLYSDFLGILCPWACGFWPGKGGRFRSPEQPCPCHPAEIRLERCVINSNQGNKKSVYQHQLSTVPFINLTKFQGLKKCKELKKGCCKMIQLFFGLPGGRFINFVGTLHYLLTLRLMIVCVILESVKLEIWALGLVG